MGNGMKSGSGDDPFADMDDEDDTPADDSGGPIEEDSLADVGAEPDQSPETTAESEPSGDASGGLPWLYQRSGIHDDRKTRQIHLQQETERRESQARSDLERQLGEAVKKADLREAALRVGLENLDEVADELRDWGYDYE